MKLNHLNLTVTDPIEAQEFLMKYFGLTAQKKGNKNMALLSDDNGIVLTLMNVSMSSESEVKYPTNFHIGFIQPTEDRVNEVHKRLTSDGYKAPAPSKQHGNWTFYFTAPGGFKIEVLC